MGQDVGRSFSIVGIGASAGGLEALRDLVRAIPADSGLCYVIIQHLAPDHPSIMDQLLGSHSDVPVVKIEDGMEAEPDKVFVIPAGPSLTLVDGCLRLHERDDGPRPRTPIDQFLTSLAEEKGREAFCVILSGTGSDGTLGLRAIKSAGGFAIVQESDSARFPGMPDSAAATGLVDFVLKPHRIPARLCDIAHHRSTLNAQDHHEELHRNIEAALEEIVALIAEGDGHDFSRYKTGTLIRRIERRMMLLRLRSVGRLIDRLREDPDERHRLLQDFLIGVTKFFRDEDAFETLRREVITPLIESQNSKLRVWVPGCSTGEEAYTVAMLFAEGMDAAGDNRVCQVFGTDIDVAALAHARAGVYSQSAVAELSEERRSRFFVRGDANYQISPELRERCVFAPHNLLEDPPFSRLDLISCRNVLIYLTPEVQETIVPRFHYGLNERGYLFLGPSEALGRKEQYFHILNREKRIFQRNDAEAPGYSTLAARRDARQRPPRAAPARTAPKRVAPGGAALIAAPERSFEHQITDFFLRESAPPFAVVNGKDDVSFLSERMGAFIRPPTGMVSPQLDQFLGRELRLPVRNAVADARRTGFPERVENIVVKEGDAVRLVDVDVRPLPFAEGSVLVTLQPVRGHDPSDLKADNDTRFEAERDLVERELVLTRQQLAATMSDYEATEQELRSSNEELLSMNEELQSSNEELETSREELQSINEELETINAELSENNKQLLDANSDLKNLFESTDIATVFLDQNLCVRRYTPASRRLFAIQDRDLGRSIKDLAWRASYDTLDEDVSRVTTTLQVVEREVRIEATDETFLMRIRPYRRTDDRIDGCVITFFDITERKRFEQQLTENAEALKRQYAELETLYDTTPVGLALLDRQLRWLRINERLAEINGYASADHIGRRQDELLPDIDAKIRDIQLRVIETGEPQLGIEVHGTTHAEPERERDWVVDYYPVRAGDTVFAVGVCVNEVTEQKSLQRRLEQSLWALRESEAQLSAALRAGGLGVFDFDPRTRAITWDAQARRIFGFGDDEDVTYEAVEGIVYPDDLEAFRDDLARAFDPSGAGRYQSVYRIVRPDTGTTRWVQPEGDVSFENGEAVRLVGTVQDITERREAEEQRELLLHELQHRVKNTMATTLAIVQFSAKRATDVATFSKTLHSRLQAIAKTHDLLTSSEWTGGSLRQIVLQQLQPYDGQSEQRSHFYGEDVQVSPKQALALSLAFHELATNAAKYGALSNDSGHVAVSAVRDDGDGVSLTWRESGGPPVTPPGTQTGFGSFLLNRVLGADIGGHASIEYAPHGVVCEIEMRLQ